MQKGQRIDFFFFLGIIICIILLNLFLKMVVGRSQLSCSGTTNLDYVWLKRKQTAWMQH